MQAKGRGDFTEPEVMISLYEDRLDWCVLLILVGEGQEIHNGENAGLILWDEAIKRGNKKWEIVCPPKLNPIFENQLLLDNFENESFDLTVSLRSHLFGAVSQFVNYIIDGDIENASKLQIIFTLKGIICTAQETLMLLKNIVKIDMLKNQIKNMVC
nr:DNA/RNA helicase domain-containing protein [uncultured Methanobrevibacter sp.]